MDIKYILLILTIIVLVFAVIGLAIELQGAKSVKPVVNNTTNNTTVSVESINNETVQESNSNYKSPQSDKSSQSANKESESGMPEETRKIYAAREKAAQDGIPMYEYTQSPELVEKYQNMV